MFRECENLSELNVSSFNTSKVTNMWGMFHSCPNLTLLDLSSFNTSNVTDMEGMFSGCTNLQSVDLGKFYTTNETNTQYMFRRCQWLRDITITAESVPVLSEKAFNYPGETVTDISQIIVHVPEDLAGQYLTTSPWKSFKNVDPIKTTGIHAIKNDKGDATIYNLQGHRQDEMRKGMNIIRQKDGQVIKIIKK